MDSQLQRAGTLLSCSLVGFVCGTLYLYSAYGPQLALKLGYSGTDASLIAFAGTIGVALPGVPAGLIIDRRGFTIPVVIGALAIVTGYIGLKDQYDDVYPNVNISVALIFLVGLGSTFINSAVIKCCAVTFPNNRGIATSFPIATYGLSAFVYSFFGSLLFKADTSRFLGFLGYSAAVICIIGLPMIFLADRNSMKGHTARAHTALRTGSRSPSIELQPYSAPFPKQKHLAEELLHKKLQTSEFGISGVIKSAEFWLVFFILGFLASLGQMYIYSVGYIVKSLLHGSDDSLVQREQQFQVSVLSISNCAGRLLSGIVGDLLSNSFKKSRGWILLIPSGCLFLVQVLGLNIDKIELLWINSVVNGLGYGFTWSSIPQLLLDFFGVKAFSFSWGFINLGPILPAYFFTHLFGSIYDSNSFLEETTGMKICDKGAQCYNGTFKISAFFAFVTLLATLWLNLKKVRTEQRKRRDSVDSA